MAQPSITSYFNIRKRSAIEELKINSARKVLILDQDNVKTSVANATPSQPTKTIENIKLNDTKRVLAFNKNQSTTKVSKSNKKLDVIKKKLTRSEKLAQLTASIKRFDESTSRLKEAEKKTEELLQSPKIKTFKSIEFEVPVSPQKVQSPEKLYLSPRKDTTPVKRNLFGSSSPAKSIENTCKSTLKLPIKYRFLIEMFEGIDTVAQILFNRKETITFKKLKPGVEKLLKRNLHEKHIAQIKFIFPEAYGSFREKLRVFGTGTKREEWELVLKPNLENHEKINEQIILERKRNLHNKLLDRVKEFHDEFLKSLEPPMIIPKDKITRWHPEFDLEKVPDVQEADIPPVPVADNLTGQQVLEKARELFGCNTKMEKALARLAERKALNTVPEIKCERSESVLKGIPKALLEKVRQKQAAKALAEMTRSDDKDKEIKLYSRLPELARLTRNIFVVEKKGVLMLSFVVEKLKNCYPIILKDNELEEILRTISNEVPGWLVFHNIRNCAYLKVAKDAELNTVLKKLESLAKEKSGS